MPDEQSGPMMSSEWTAALVASVLKIWPSPEAPMALQFAFCVEMRRAIAPFTTMAGPHADWFRGVDSQLVQTLVALQKLVSAAEQEAKNVRDRLTKLMRYAPPELQAAIRRAQERR